MHECTREALQTPCCCLTSPRYFLITAGVATKYDHRRGVFEGGSSREHLTGGAALHARHQDMHDTRKHNRSGRPV